MIYNIRNIEVNISLEPGIYIFEPDSGTGKSYLCKLLHDLNKIGENVLSITLDEWEDNKDNLINKITSNDYDVIMFDRFGLYADSAVDAVKGIDSTKCVVLIDTKYKTGGLSGFYECSIKFDTERVLVSE